jgi:hypothetical protein
MRKLGRGGNRKQSYFRPNYYPPIFFPEQILLVPTIFTIRSVYWATFNPILIFRSISFHSAELLPLSSFLYYRSAAILVSQNSLFLHSTGFAGPLSSRLFIFTSISFNVAEIEQSDCLSMSTFAIFFLAHQRSKVRVTMNSQ